MLSIGEFTKKKDLPRRRGFNRHLFPRGNLTHKNEYLTVFFIVHGSGSSRGTFQLSDRRRRTADLVDE